MAGILRHGRGVSLVEILMVIGVLAVMVGLLLPSLGGARAAAKRTQCMAEMRQLGTRVTIYASNNGDYVPFVYTRDPGSGQWVLPNGELVGDEFFGTAADFWIQPMLEEFGNSFTDEQVLCPNDRVSVDIAEWASGVSGVPVAEVGVPLVRTMSRSFYYSPGSLRADSVEYEENRHRVAKISDVRYPSAKAFLVEDQPFHDEYRVGDEFVVEAEMPFSRMVVATDMSVALRSIETGITVLPMIDVPGGHSGDREAYLRVQRLLGAFHFTRDGVHGRDW